MSRSNSDLSVIIITKDEEQNIERCLKSLPEGCDIVVVDSGSNDKTVAIAKSFGCRVFTRKFTNFAEQKNYALEQAHGNWVLSMDADEELVGVDSVADLTPKETTSEAFRICRKLSFMGKTLGFGKTKDAPVRLFKSGVGRFENPIHERFAVPSNPGKIRANIHLIHYSYKDLTDYFLRFNRYTSQIAQNHLEKNRRIPLLHLVLRPWFEFIIRYILRLGFLDGYPGYCYALISSHYAFIKFAKLKELRERQ
ncbi:MAG: glycosyltransferase family 2 protein [Pseudobacteriovorax sp.]|nr:glycosyltransferase family 2 protein [Pseudobacteriovorax sp.]